MFTKIALIAYLINELHAVLSYKERLYKERLVEHENDKERTLVKLGRVKEHLQFKQVCTHVFSQ